MLNFDITELFTESENIANGYVDNSGKGFRTFTQDELDNDESVHDVMFATIKNLEEISMEVAFLNGEVWVKSHEVVNGDGNSVWYRVEKSDDATVDMNWFPEGSIK